MSAEPGKPPLKFIAPTINHAQQIWQLVEESGVLDPNSAYLYLLLCRDFAGTCLVACRGGELSGFVTGYRLPTRPTTLFIWQVGVAAQARRQGIALKMLSALIDRCEPGSVTAIEATVAPSNLASRRLFAALARQLDAPLIDRPEDGFAPQMFPPGDHEAEPRIHIGPLQTVPATSR